MWYGPIKKKENVCPCGEKVEILFWGGESWNVEMLLQAKQLPQLLSEMPRVDTVWLQNTKQEQNTL